MLVLIGADEGTLESPVSKRFGHAPYFILYDTESHTLTAEENTREGHNHDNLYGYLEKGVEAFIVGNIGPHAFQIINTSKSKVYLARKMSVQEAVDKLSIGGLTQLSEPTAKKSIGHRHENGGHHCTECHDHEHI